MSRFGNIFYLCLVFGALWGAIWIILITLLALFMSGELFQPQVTAGALAGLVTAGVLTGFATERRTIAMRALCGVIFILVLTVASGATPLGLPMSVHLFGQLVFIVLTAWIKGAVDPSDGDRVWSDP